MGSLTGRVGIVTGASRGIGKAIALRLAEEGASVAITARSVEKGSGGHLPGSLDETADEIRALGAQVIVAGLDLADPDADLEGFVAEVADTLGPVDILINNAAACFYLPFEKMSPKRMRVAYEVNVVAPLRLAQAVTPAMRTRGQGWILNISTSIAVNKAGPPWKNPANYAMASAYGSTKAALNRLTESLAVELHEDGIAVNSLAPQKAVRTEGQMAVMADLPDEYFEPMESFVDAAFALVTGDPATQTARVTKSLDLLDELSGR